ncbi:expansin EXLX1 family cellulose-binding protein [Catenulispora subtropica]|uniref:RlpA-like protein double-psi beta-barrel domain-containing protein n=1 Tax=Catenulispora subtropica TaxID=450798 RepID=A0ABP5CUH2_9ACTN
MTKRRLFIAMAGACLVLTGIVGCGGNSQPEAAAGSGVAAASSSTGPDATRTATPGSQGTSATPAAAPSPASSAATSSPPSAPPSTSSSSPPPSAGALAGRIRPGTSYQGVATAYDAGDGTGACLFDPTDDPMIAAMNVADYESAKACGASILIHAANGKSITVRIVNECPAPYAPGQIDLSRQAFAKLADLKVGRLPITWTLQSPDTAGTISIRYKTGSSQWWCGIQVIGHRNPVASLEVRAGGEWRKLPREDYNYFVSAGGSGCGGQIRVTDIYGQQLVIDGIAVSPNVTQRTAVQFARH